MNRNILREIIILFVSGLSVLFLWKGSNYLIPVLLAILVLQIVFQKSWGNVGWAVVIFLVAFAYEAIYVNFGTWSYPYGHFLNVPIWIPISWTIFFLGLKEIFLKSSSRSKKI